MKKLQLLNPKILKESEIYVDSKYNFENEQDFDSKNLVWIFYGNAYNYKLNNDGIYQINYGLNYSWGYLESLNNPNIKYDVIYGLLIPRINVSDDNYESSDDENYILSNNNIKKKKY